MRTHWSPHAAHFGWALLCAVALFAAPSHAAEETPDQVLQKLNARNDALGDAKARMIISEQQGQIAVSREAHVFWRHQKHSLVVLFSKPKTYAGNGYLRLENNLWSYDAKVGNWERRTEREQIGGTNVRRSDIDGVDWSADYTVTDGGNVKVGDQTLRQLVLKAKPGAEVAFPVVHMYLNQNDVPVKTEEYALSGMLLRTTLVTSLAKLTSKVNGQIVWVPLETRVFDQVDKSRKTLMKVEAFELGKVEDATFTKAWLEGKSR